MTTIDTLSPAAARAALDTARTETAEARELADALADRVRDGDPDVTPQQLAEAQQLADFAALRITAAERRLAAALDTDRDARARTAADDARRLVDSDDAAELATAVRAVAEAITRLVGVAEERQARVHAMGTTVGGITDELYREYPDLRDRLAHMRSRYKVSGNERAVTVYEPRRTIAAVPPAELVAAAVALGLPDLTLAAELRALFDAPDASATRVVAAVPAVGDDWRPSNDEWAALSPGERARAGRLGLRPAN
ncbi:hypothetical protein [Streptomyces wuyuanensis]|uniref:hypothetical protein n=1 Tax=Streptomyces wuyuanensis TaxID=1196353 RepID=UPI00344A4173